MQRIILIIIILFQSILAFTQEHSKEHPLVLDKVNIWESQPAHDRVMMWPYLASGKGNKAIIVCPGGSYFWHDMKYEGHQVAEWLQANGITAFVLKYRTACAFAFATRYRYLLRGTRYPDAQDDLLQAIRYIKQHAAAYGIDTCQIGVMGFSAGGHLAMSAAELYAPQDRPAFVVPVYPVVTLEGPWTHKRSRRGLLGDSRKGNRQLRDSLSLQKHVPQDCPPVFLVNCKDDPVVDWHNSVLLDSALTAKNIPHRYLQYQTGGHGFGASSQKGSPECRQWKNEFLKWIKTIR